MAKAKEVTTEPLQFSVASALWEELGERLVGRSPMALAELIKNSYDADARNVEIVLDRNGKGSIVVSDDGHGMTREEFISFWMRVGETHKKEEARSRFFHRPLTGSKGVGRIAARLLSHKLRITTVPRSNPSTRLTAELDWRQATRVKDLTQAQVLVTYETLGEKQPYGTRIELIDLREQWNTEEVREVAQEVWRLQPPFLDPGAAASDKRAFHIQFRSPEGELTATFREQMEAILDLWEARITGTIAKGKAIIAIEFEGESQPIKRTIAHPSWTGTLVNADFEIRVYSLQRRQKHGVRVKEAREYIRDFHGVHIYDAGFRLPYYGTKQADWLGLTTDHARRISKSELLPAELQVKEGLQHLPHLEHLLGVVNVDTTREEDLEITIGRDRLKESEAFRELSQGVRAAIDLYAVEKAKRRFEEVERKLGTRRPSAVLRTVEEVLEEYRADISKPVFKDLKAAVGKAVETNVLAEEQRAQETGVLGSLASAGISAVAFQHEITKQLLVAERLIRKLSELEAKPGSPAAQLKPIRLDLEEWLSRTRAIGGLFGHLSQAENVRETANFAVDKVVNQTIARLQPLLPGVGFKTSADPTATFPPATYAEWVSILQNVMFNAANAMQDSKAKRLHITVKKLRRKVSLTIQDTGSGVDLENADRLFLPFERGTALAEERKAAGFGGTGLGLTIVKMIAERRGCRVGFVEPDSGFNTAFNMEWEETA